MKTFLLKRTRDISDVSGIGIVAEGMVFSDGTVILKWLSNISSINIYKNVQDMLTIHNHIDTKHEGGTSIIWE